MLVICIEISKTEEKYAPVRLTEQKMMNGQTI